MIYLCNTIRDFKLLSIQIHCLNAKQRISLARYLYIMMIYPSYLFLFVNGRLFSEIKWSFVLFGISHVINLPTYPILICHLICVYLINDYIENIHF